MKRALPWIAIPVMFGVIVLLALRLKRPEAPLGASRTPPSWIPQEATPAGALRVAPETLEHPCPACGSCPHQLEIVQERRLLTLPVPPRGRWTWEKAGGLYYFDDPSYFAAAASRSESGAGAGSWELDLRYQPKPHSPGTPHACSAVPGSLNLVYDLVVSEDPIPEERQKAPGGLEILSSIEWMSSLKERPGAPPTLLNFGWRLRGVPRVELSACRCGIP